MLDPLILRISEMHPRNLVSIERRQDGNGCFAWVAYCGKASFSVTSKTPEEAVASLLTGASERAAKRKAEIEAELVRLNAELAQNKP